MIQRNSLPQTQSTNTTATLTLPTLNSHSNIISSLISVFNGNLNENELHVKKAMSSGNANSNESDLVLRDDDENASSVIGNSVARDTMSNNKLRTLNVYIKEELNQIRNAYQDEIDYHNKNEFRNSTVETKSVVIERQGGLANRFVLLLLLLWYFFSATTLYTNKYIVTSQKADPTIIGELISAYLLFN